MSELPAIAFQLPQGLKGFLRPATGADELYVSRHPQAQGNPAYATLLMLARTVVQLGEVRSPAPEQLGDLLLADFHYLRDLFNRCNPPAAQRSGERPATRSSGSTAR